MGEMMDTSLGGPPSAADWNRGAIDDLKDDVYDKLGELAAIMQRLIVRIKALEDKEER